MEAKRFGQSIRARETRPELLGQAFDQEDGRRPRSTTPTMKRLRSVEQALFLRSSVQRIRSLGRAWKVLSRLFGQGKQKRFKVLKLAFA